MTEAAQNALLKTIEEPPEYGIVILMTSNISALLPTIQSRCSYDGVSSAHALPLWNRMSKNIVRCRIIRPERCAAFAQGNVGKAMR